MRSTRRFRRLRRFPARASCLDLRHLRNLRIAFERKSEGLSVISSCSRHWECR
jgi:hypothetical protein